MDYLLKVSVAWVLLLLLFEAVYKNNGRFTANRVYLVGSLCLGLLLPLVPLPVSTPQVLHTQQLYTAARNIYPAQVVAMPASGAATTTVMAVGAVDVPQHLNIPQAISIIYAIGVLLLLAKCILELGKLLLLIAKKPAQIIDGHTVIATGKVHSPYSFMGRIFITHVACYTSEELAYILRHEAAHNTSKHWADLWLMQLACTALWFHPLVWRYRYLLRLQHEYEADSLAANTDPYTYGHFLLQQTLLSGVPAIAHSFHFSPIKNRINMLTKNPNSKTGSRKYLLPVPVLLCCTFLMANNVGVAKAPFKDNVLTWRNSDTLFYNPITRRAIRTDVNQTEPRQIATSINGQTVYQNEYLAQPATGSIHDTSFAELVRSRFIDMVKNTDDSLARMSLTSLVISKEGKVIDYKVRYYRPREIYGNGSKLVYPFPKPEPALDALVEKIITDSPAWKPAAKDNKPVISFVSFYGGGC